jgi:hypothetical protein
VAGSQPVSYEFWNGSAWAPGPARSQYLLSAEPTGESGSFATWRFELPVLSDGPHEIRAIATDTDGETLTTYRPFIMDQTGPSVQITQPVQGNGFDTLAAARIRARDLNGLQQKQGQDRVEGMLRRYVPATQTTPARYEYWVGGHFTEKRVPPGD